MIRSVSISLIALLPLSSLAIENGTETFGNTDISLLDDGRTSPAGVTVSYGGWDFTTTSVSDDSPISYDIWDNNFGNGVSLTIYEPSSSDNVDFDSVRITPSGAYLFDLDSIYLSIELFNGVTVVNNQDFTLQGLDINGNVISGAELTLPVNNTSETLYDTATIVQFDQIAGLRMVPVNSSLVMSYISIDSITVSNVTPIIPEPASIAGLMGGAALALGIAARRPKRRNATA